MPDEAIIDKEKGLLWACEEGVKTWLLSIRVERENFSTIQESFITWEARKVRWAHEHLENILKIW